MRVKSGLIIKEQLSQLVVNTCLGIYIFMSTFNLSLSSDDVINKFFFLFSFFIHMYSIRKRTLFLYSSLSHTYISSPSTDQKKNTIKRKSLYILYRIDKNSSKYLHKHILHFFVRRTMYICMTCYYNDY